jgi:hypothetical protein
MTKKIARKKPLPPPPPKPFDATKDLDDTAPHEEVGLQAALDTVVVELDKKNKECRFLEGERDSARGEADRLRAELTERVEKFEKGFSLEIEALKSALRDRVLEVEALKSSISFKSAVNSKTLPNERVAKLEAFIRKAINGGFNYSEAGEVLKP